MSASVRRSHRDLHLDRPIDWAMIFAILLTLSVVAFLMYSANIPGAEPLREMFRPMDLIARLFERIQPVPRVPIQFPL